MKLRKIYYIRICKFSSRNSFGIFILKNKKNLKFFWLYNFEIVKLWFTVSLLYNSLYNWRLEICLCRLRGSSFRMIHKGWFMSRNTRIMCWNIDRERRKRGPDAAGIRRFILLADIALAQVNGIAQGWN